MRGPIGERVEQESAARQMLGVASPLVVRIDGSAARDPGHLGGKGAWLARLVEAGFEVPGAWVLTTDAYRRAAQASAPQALFDELRAAREAGTIGPDASAVDAAFLEAEMDPEVGVAIRAAASSALAGSPSIAVRSSASAEDLHGTSFAGQYSSFLDVDLDGVERAVRLVWASLWHPSPRAYRAAQGVDEADLAMAVVLMRQVPAEQAGVVFTIDPGTGADMLRVEGVAGLGDSLVSGAVTPWVCLVPRSNVRGGTVDPSEGAPADADQVARRVAAVALEVEARFGEPQDIEWALADGDLWVLQARPITSIGRRDDGFDSTTGPDDRWTTAGIAEMLPGVLPPLLWDLNHRLVEEALRQHFDRLGALPADIDERGGFLARFRGRAAMSLDAMEAIAGAMPGAGSQQVSEVERQYFGIATGERPAAAEVRRGLRGISHDRALARERREARLASATIVEATAVVVDEEPDLSSLDERALLTFRVRVLDLAGRAMAAEVAVAASASAAYRRLELVLLRRFDEREASRWAQRTTTGTARLRGPSAPDPRSSRAVFAGPTWREQAASRTSAGAPSARQHPGPGPTTIQEAWDDMITRLRSQQGWLSMRALTGQIVDVRLLVLRRLVEDANELLDQREDAKAAVLALGGVMRRIHLELGARLVVDGILESAAQVDVLGERELVRAAQRPSRAEVARRTRWLAGQQDAPLPQRFRGPPHSVDHAKAKGSVLHGWAAGPGRHTGPARVLTSPDVSEVVAGDVIVATTTDASWAPVFLLAGAIVVEQGGPLSHAAIVARELGIPAVLNIPGVVARLAGSRSVLAVDGDEGLVVVVDEVGNDEVRNDSVGNGERGAEVPGGT